MKKPAWTKTAPSATQSAVCPHCQHDVTIETIVQKDVAELFYGLENLKKRGPQPPARERQREGAKIAQGLIHNVLRQSRRRASRGKTTPRRQKASQAKRGKGRGRSL